MQLEDFLAFYALIGGIVPLLNLAFEVLSSLCA
jgi:hypothetical protein